MSTTLVTGPPRSGTTLLVSLLNDLPDSVGLAEPMRWGHGDVARAVREVEAFVVNARRDALAGKALRNKTSTHAEGDGWWESPKPDHSLRATRMVVRDYVVGKPLSPNFRLFIKHPAAFSALASALEPHFPIVIIVRDPLATLCAWQTIDMPIRTGRLPNAEAFRPELRAALDDISSALLRQVKIMETLLLWYLAITQATVIRYEDLVRSPRQTLERIAGGAPEPKRRIYLNELSRYGGVDVAENARALVSISATVERFYPDFSQTLAKYI